MLTTTLVIVESPSKCKKIEGYLGPGYKCVASFGHLRSLVSLHDIDIQNNFACCYSILDDPIKKKQIEYIRKCIIETNDIILATDDDREGEAIAWHICQLFDLSVEKTKRIVFHEITEEAIQKAIRNPTIINMNVVQSQQTRQILDLLVGYTISPFLWKCIAKNTKHSLSAGRCQSPALKLIYDNYLEIQSAPGVPVYHVIGYFTNMCIPFELNHSFTEEEQVIDFLENSVEYIHKYTVSEPRQVIKTKPLPFTTSSLQQVASNELHYSPKETMKYAQQLYEEGYITYMRTDCKKYSSSFVSQVNQYILNTYNNELYLHENIEDILIQTTDTLTKVSSSSLLAQEAHEAIRPVSILLKTVDTLDGKAKRLYELIWRRTLESCMADAKYSSISAEISAYHNYGYKYTSEQIIFPGWKSVENKYEKITKSYQYLLTIKQEAVLDYTKIEATITLKDTKSHYTEARLVQLLEEKGIGRPSTFSSLVDKIQERGYVKKENVPGKKRKCTNYILEANELTEQTIEREFGNEKNKLVIQPLGIIVIDFLFKWFEPLFHYDYTREMENELDVISKGNQSLSTLCEKCYTEMNTCIEAVKNEKKIEIHIDDNHVFLFGKNGPVIKYVDPNDKSKVEFKPVVKDIDMNKLENGEYLLEELIDTNKPKIKPLGKYQTHDLFIKKGKFGLYAEWGENKQSLKSLGNRPIENITYIEVLTVLEKEGLLDTSKPYGVVRKVTSHISIRTGKFGDYIFYQTNKMKQPQFFKLLGFKGDYKKGDLVILQKWIKDTYHIE